MLGLGADVVRRALQRAAAQPGAHCSLGEQPRLRHRCLAPERAVGKPGLVGAFLAPTAARIALGIGSANVRCVLRWQTIRTRTARTRWTLTPRFKDSTGSKTTTDRLDDARGGLPPLYAALLTVAPPGRLDRDRTPAGLGPARIRVCERGIRVTKSCSTTCLIRARDRRRVRLRARRITNAEADKGCY